MIHNPKLKILLVILTSYLLVCGSCSDNDNYKAPIIEEPVIEEPPIVINDPVTPISEVFVNV